MIMTEIRQHYVLDNEALRRKLLRENEIKLLSDPEYAMRTIAERKYDAPEGLSVISGPTITEDSVDYVFAGNNTTHSFERLSVKFEIEPDPGSVISHVKTGPRE